MADWDADSARLRSNLESVLAGVADAALRREPLTLKDIKQWHAATLKGLDVPSRLFVGRFRGERGLETCRVRLGTLHGVAPSLVAGELADFSDKLTAATAELDARCPTPDDLDADGLAAVVELAAWAHAEWVRIHPFANGNGRTARILANALLMRYGLPPALRLRPRPDGAYTLAGQEAMKGDWTGMVAFLRSSVLTALSAPDS